MDAPVPTAVETARETRLRLLEVAERRFSEQGFATASVRDITAAAGVNLAAVNYHFGGKENLYRAVFERRLSALKERRLSAVRAEAARPAATAESAVHTLLLAVLEPYVDVQEGVRVTHLVIRELADPRLERGLCSETFAESEAELAALLCRVVPGLDEAAVRPCIAWLYGMTWQIVFGVKNSAAPNACLHLGCSYQEAVERAVRFACAGLRAEAAAARGDGNA